MTSIWIFCLGSTSPRNLPFLHEPKLAISLIHAPANKIIALVQSSQKYDEEPRAKNFYRSNSFHVSPLFNSTQIDQSSHRNRHYLIHTPVQASPPSHCIFTMQIKSRRKGPVST